MFQSVTHGPFGRTGNDFTKTISYYDKGPVLGLLLDFKIRHHYLFFLPLKGCCFRQTHARAGRKFTSFNSFS